MLVLNTIKGTFAFAAAVPMFEAACKMGPDWLKEVEGRFTKIRSAPATAADMAAASEKSAEMCSTDLGLMSEGSGLGVRDMATTVCPVRARWCT